MSESDKLEVGAGALIYISTRLQADPRLAYIAGPGSEFYDRLTNAISVIRGFDPASVRSKLEERLQVQPIPPIGDGFRLVDYQDRRLEIDCELYRRMSEYNDHAHDMHCSEGLSLVVNHFLRAGIERAEQERDARSLELF